MTRRRAKVLIVDDSPIIRELAQHVLQEDGYEVIGLDSPTGFSRALVQEKPDIVLMDVSMPALSGDKLVEILWQPPVEHILDALADRLLSAIGRLDARRLVIDGLVGFKLSASAANRLTRFFAALANELRARDVTTLVTDDQRDSTAGELELPLARVSALWENLVLLRAEASPAGQVSSSSPSRRSACSACRGIRLTQAASRKTWPCVPGKQARAAAMSMRFLYRAKLPIYQHRNIAKCKLQIAN